MRLFLSIFLYTLSMLSIADEQPYKLQIQEPVKKVGYFVGDIIERSIKIETSKSYRLSIGSLPVKGITRNNIELHDIKLIESHKGDHATYFIQLKYQIFARADYAAKFNLPEETLTLVESDKSLNISIPTWSFTVSPLASKAEAYIAEDASSYRGPMLVEFGYFVPAFMGSLLVVIASLFGLIYINGNDTWLPKMGGTFASSYLKIATLSDGNEQLEDATNLLHQSFNKTYGENLFQRDIERFVKTHPSFKPEVAAIKEFFQQSNCILFGEEVSAQNGLLEMKRLAKVFRHCERGVA